MSYSSRQMRGRYYQYPPDPSPTLDLESLDGFLHPSTPSPCLRSLYGIFNVLILVLGGGAVGVGMWSSFTFYKITPLFGTNVYYVICFVCIIVGLFVVFFLFTVGCLGTFNDKLCCMNLYSAGLMLVFLANVAICLMTITYKLMIRRDLIRHLHYSFFHRDGLATKKAFNYLQQKLKCCGLVSYADWLQVDSPVNSTSQVPDTCCITETLNCALERHHPSNIYYEGCAKPLENILQQQLNIICLGSLAMCSLELIGITIACCLIKRTKESTPTMFMNRK